LKGKEALQGRGVLMSAQSWCEEGTAKKVKKRQKGNKFIREEGEVQEGKGRPNM